MKEEYHQWNSLYLSRDFDMLVFGHNGFPVIFFPPAKGRYYDAKEFGLIGSVSSLIESGKIKIYCPDTIDGHSWFNYSIQAADRVKTHNGYENLIINDVIAFAVHETGYKTVALAGCDLGAYHALNLALRHPNLVSSVITMSGIIDIKRYIWGFYDDNCYFNNPLDYLPGLNDPWYLEKINKIKIILGVTANDIYLNESVRISEILNYKGVTHKLDIIHHGEHGWGIWKEMFGKYLAEIFS